MDDIQFRFKSIACLLLVYMADSSGVPRVCPRDKSRVVTELVREKILPGFKKLSIPLAASCQFDVERNLFAAHEDHKVMEHASKFTCDFCGKSFISEYFLDNHLENRHEDHIQTENAVCMADLCDVFRCDIVSGSVTPDYWDIALCLEDDMKDLYSQCEAIVDKCIPSTATQNQSLTVKDLAMDGICGFLTCSKFWDSPVFHEDNSSIALYVVLITMTSFGILIYNFVFYQYFYSEFEDRHSYRPSKRERNIQPYHRPHKYSSH